ncbi:AAA family ATPase [Enterococcus durans]|uniref:AAA family ATPase n=1 Tax=Enterococcus durans TaxID=53345 RepID=UPI002072C6DF|nr:AAA family ATPase [Enterococcus durans]MCM6855222.1 AAA family ATPase [Enterococcus durans]
MVKVLLTGMSGVGKSTVLKQISKSYSHSIDLDYDGWIHMEDVSNERKMDTNKIINYIQKYNDEDIFFSGTTINQKDIYPYLDFIITLTAPIEIMRERILTRDNNSFGKSNHDWEKIKNNKIEFEQLIIKSSDFVISTEQTVNEIVYEIYNLVGLNNNNL